MSFRESYWSLSALADDFTPGDSRLFPQRNTQYFESFELPPADTISQTSLQGNGNGALASPYDPFVTASTPLSAAGAVGAVSANPYSHDAAAALTGAFFPGQTGFQQPVRMACQRDLI